MFCKIIKIHCMFYEIWLIKIYEASYNVKWKTHHLYVKKKSQLLQSASHQTILPTIPHGCCCSSSSLVPLIHWRSEHLACCSQLLLPSPSLPLSRWFQPHEHSVEPLTFLSSSSPVVLLSTLPQPSPPWTRPQTKVLPLYLLKTLNIKHLTLLPQPPIFSFHSVSYPHSINSSASLR